MVSKFLVVMIFVSVASLSAMSLRIEPAELSKNLSEYKIVDAREVAVFTKGHIEGAYNFPTVLTFENVQQNGKIAQPNKMQKLIRTLGLSVNDKVVVYDEGNFFDAARLFWTLEAYGFTNVKMLNGGFGEWEAKSLGVSTKIVTPQESGYIATVNNKKLATKFTTQIAIKNPNQVIIDARNLNAYVGKESSAVRFGHIAKALHVPAVHNLSGDKNTPKLKPISELAELYRSVDKDSKVIIYCNVGKISGTNYFAMRELGFDVSNYDASWNEWGNDLVLPIENPSEKK
jgi:thiosulfate/3-mercaptopyruvate sulfurtransferase